MQSNLFNVRKAFSLVEMMVVLLILAVVLAIVVPALSAARNTARKLADLTQMYWALKFEHGELKAKVEPRDPPTPEPRQTFVPLASMRKP